MYVSQQLAAHYALSNQYLKPIQPAAAAKYSRCAAILNISVAAANYSSIAAAIITLVPVKFSAASLPTLQPLYICSNHYCEVLSIENSALELIHAYPLCVEAGTVCRRSTFCRGW